MSDWRQRQPLHLGSEGELVLASVEAGLELLQAAGGRADEEDSSAAEQLIEEAATGALLMRSVPVPIELPFVSDRTLAAVETGFSKNGWMSPDRIDRHIAQVGPFRLEEECLATAELVVVRALRLGGPRRPGGSVPVLTVPLGTEGVALLGTVEPTRIVRELHAGRVVLRQAVGSRILFIFKTWPRKGSALFPCVKRYGRARAKVALIQERLARKAAR